MMGPKNQFCVAFLLALAVGSPGNARPLGKDDCTHLSAERGKLAEQGVEKAIVKGPEWTRANMSPGMLEMVRRYLSVEEQLRFRCRGFNPPDLAPEQSVAATGPAASPEPVKAAAATHSIPVKESEVPPPKPPEAAKRKPAAAPVRKKKKTAAKPPQAPLEQKLFPSLR